MGDDLYIHQLSLQKNLWSEFGFISICKSFNYKTLQKYLSGVKLSNLSLCKPILGNKK